MMDIKGEREQLGSLVGELVLNGSLRRAGYNFKELIGFPNEKDVIEIAHNFLCASNAKKTLRRSRIGMVGYMSMSMYPASFDHLLMRTMIGPEIVHVDSYTLIERSNSASISKKKEIADKITSKLSGDRIAKELVDKSASLYCGLKDIIEENYLDGINVKCQYELSKYFGCTACVPLSILSDEGYVCACEGDIPTQVTMHILKALSGETPTYVDLLDFNKQNVYLSSCGLAPFSLASKKHREKISKACFNGFNGLVSSVVLKPGILTLARLSEKIGEYELIYTIGEGLNSSELRQEIMPAISVNLKNEIKSKINNLSSQHLALVYGDLEDRIIDFANIMSPHITIRKI
jgi:L-fucose isomerase-like protein